MATKKNTKPVIIMSAEDAQRIALQQMKAALESRTNLSRKGN